VPVGIRVAAFVIVITKQYLRSFLLSLAVIFFVSCIPLCGFAQAAPQCSPLFGTDQDILAPIQARIGRTLYIRELNSTAKTWVYISDLKNLERMAFVDFYYHDHILDIGFMKVDQYKKSGLGEALFKLVLRKYPDTQVIQVRVLVEDNKAALEQALKEGATLEEAIKRTPSYKIRAKFGFTEIIPESILSEKDGYGYAVRRKK
jgi:hypothetical protein